MKKMMMIAALMVATLSANAQREVGSVTLKPMVGMTISNMTKAPSSKALVGLAAGAEVEYQISNSFSLTGGLIYSMQGCKSEENLFEDVPAVANYKMKATVHEDYLNIPILANFYVTKGLALKAGIQPGFNVRNSMTVEGNKIAPDYKANTMDLSIPFGISYEFSDFVIDFRYQLGLTNIFKKLNYEGDVYETKSKNSVFMISLGYKI